MKTDSGKRAIRRTVTAVISLSTLVLAIIYAGPVSSLRELHEMDPGWVSSGFAFLVIATGLAAVRFRMVLRTFGFVPDVRTLLQAYFIGQVSHTFLLNVAGQSVTRAALLNSSGIPTSVTIAATFFERIMAAALLFVFSIAASLFVLSGLSLDWSAGGASFVWLVTGFGVAVAAAVVTVARLLEFDRPVGRTIQTLIRFWPSAAVTIVIQLLTLCVWAVLVIGVTGAGISLEVLGALVVVMFASKLPVSFGGWGVRELSAGYALGVVGIEPSIAVAAAIAMGLLSLVLVLFSGGIAAAFLRMGRPIPPAARDEGGALTRIDMGRVLPVLGVAMVGVLLYFQVHVPTDSGALTVNLADLGAITAAGLLAVQLTMQRNFGPIPRPFALWLIALTAVIGLGLVTGYLEYGLNEWAIWNRGVGWLVLLGYVAAGAAVAYATDRGQLRMIFGGIIAAGLAITVLYIVAYVVDLFTGGLDDIPLIPIRGFAANANAYTVQLIGVMAIAAAAHRARIFSGSSAVLVMTVAIVGAGMYLSFSRSGYGMYVLALILMIIAAPRQERWAEVARITLGVVVATVIVGLIYTLPELVQLLKNLIGEMFRDGGEGGKPTGVARDLYTGHRGTDKSDTERWQSLVEGWDLWIQNPVLGSGLGAQVERYRAVGEFPLIIHCTPLWLLAETGLVGLLVALAGLLALVIWAWQALSDPSRAGWALGAGIVVVCVSGGGLFHDFAYQRVFWFLLAMFLTLGLGRPRRPESTGLVQDTEADLQDDPVGG